MAIKRTYNPSPINIKPPNNTDYYIFSGTEFSPALFSRKIENHPDGGEHVFLCWNLSQANEFMNQSINFVPLLCIDFSSNRMLYCQDMESVINFYSGGDLT